MCQLWMQMDPRSQDRHAEADKNGRHFTDEIFESIFLNENFEF